MKLSSVVGNKRRNLFHSQQIGLECPVYLKVCHCRFVLFFLSNLRLILFKMFVLQDEEFVLENYSHMSCCTF